MTGQDKKFRVILSDCPWAFHNWTDKAHGSPKPHYSVQTHVDIANVPVWDWADEDCVLFHWGCWSKLTEALYVMQEWGFEYVTAIPWVKTIPKNEDLASGVGFWTRGCSEVLLIGRMGAPKNKLPREETPLGLLVGDEPIFYAPRKKHSQKPEILQDWIEKKFDGPYLELYATRTRPNWTCWGLSTGWRLSEHGVERVESRGPVAAGGPEAVACGSVGDEAGGRGHEGGDGSGTRQELPNAALGACEPVASGVDHCDAGDGYRLPSDPGPRELDGPL